MNIRWTSIRDRSPDINEPAQAITVPLVVFFDCAKAMICRRHWPNFDLFFMHDKEKIALGSILLLCKGHSCYISFMFQHITSNRLS